MPSSYCHRDNVRMSKRPNEFAFEFERIVQKIFILIFDACVSAVTVDVNVFILSFGLFLQHQCRERERARENTRLHLCICLSFSFVVFDFYSALFASLPLLLLLTLFVCSVRFALLRWVLDKPIPLKSYFLCC